MDVSKKFWIEEFFPEDNDGGELANDGRVLEMLNEHTMEGRPLDENRISKPFKKLRKALRKLPRKAAPEQAHNLRTAARRIEVTIHALTLDSSENSSDLLKPLTRLRKKAGKVRDMDVLTAHTSHILISQGDPRNGPRGEV